MTKSVIKIPDTVKLGTITAIVEGPQGKAGKDGSPGSPGSEGKSAFEVWLSAGNNGTIDDYFNAIRGAGLVPKGTFVLGNTYEMNDYVLAAGTATDTSIYFCTSSSIFIATLQPRNDASNWAELAAPAGANGKDVELRLSDGYIQWHNTGDSGWQNLVAIADITVKGDPGKDGAPGKDGTDGKSFSVDASGPTADKALHDDAAEGFSFLDTTTGNLYIHGVGSGVWSDPIPFKGDKGDAGKNIELRKTDTEIQWRVVGSDTWTTLALLSELKGENGKSIELQKGTTHIQWKLETDSAWTDLIAIADLQGTAGSAWYSGAVEPATFLGVIGDWYLNTSNGQVLSKTGSSTWTLQFTFPSASNNTASTWLLLVSDPVSTTGVTGNWALNSTNSTIWQKANDTTWNKVLTVPAFATQAQGLEASSYDVISSPARVREFVEQFGFTASYMPAATDMNTITGSTDKTVVINFNNNTVNTPITGSYGRGIQFAGGGNYSTQLVWINDTSDSYIRFHNGTEWAAWKPVTKRVAFRIESAYSISLQNSINGTFSSVNTIINDGLSADAITNPGGAITVPLSGIYQVNAGFACTKAYSGAVITEPKNINILVNNASRLFMETHGAQNSDGRGAWRAGGLISLSAGDVITATFNQWTQQTMQTVIGPQTFLEGYKIS